MTPREKLRDDARERPPLRDVLAAAGMSPDDIERYFWPISEFVARARDYQRERAALIAEEQDALSVARAIRNTDN